jgi:hypothetical protein
MTPETVFTTLHFLHNLQMGPIRVERLARDKYSSLLGPFVSFEENRVL